MKKTDQLSVLNALRARAGKPPLAPVSQPDQESKLERMAAKLGYTKPTKESK